MLIVYLVALYFAFAKGGLTQKSTRMHINETNSDWIVNNLVQFKQQLAEVTQLIISRSYINQTILHQILSSEMPSLLVLNFAYQTINFNSPFSLLSKKNPQILTPKLLQQIFKSKYFPNLIQLHLISTNIDDKYLNFLDNYKDSRQLKLQKLSLDNNLIGKNGFRRLSYLKFNKLTFLSLSNNLLIQKQAVDYVLTIICGSSIQSFQNQSKTCLNGIKHLDLSYTHIQPDLLVRLIKALQYHSLQQLSINNINLHQGKRYSTPFNVTPYQLFAQIQFPNLRRLEMDWMNLDDQILQLFTTWRFPKLDYLSINRNFIGDVGIKAWLSKQNMPMLRSLNIYSNDVTKSGLQFIIQQHPNLNFINLGKNQIESSALRLIVQLPLQNINLKLSKVDIEDLQFIFQNINPSLVRQISLSNNNHIEQLFMFMNWQKFNNLQILYLKNSFLGSSIMHLLKYKDKLLSNTVKYIWLNDVGNNGKIMMLLLNSIDVMFPFIQFISMVQRQDKLINFTQLDNNFIKSTRFTVQLSHITFSRATKHRILKLKSLLLIIKHSSKYQFKDLSGSQYDTKIRYFVEQLNNTFEISSLRQLIINNILQYKIWCFWISLYKIEMRVEMLQVKCQLNITQMIYLLTLMGNKYRSLSIQLTIDKDQKQLDELVLCLSSFSFIQIFKLEFLYGKTNKRYHIHNYNQLLNTLYFPFLTSLYLTSQLEVQQIADIIRKHSCTIRQLSLPYNFIQKLLIQLLDKYEIVLRYLSLAGIFYSAEEFSFLGKMQLGFLAQLNLDRCELRDQHFNKMITIRNRPYLFPKMKILSLNQNQIQETGLILLLESFMPELTFLNILKTNNPNYLNIILQFRNQIIQISSYELQLNPISQKLHETSTRAIETLFIKQFNFKQSDYAILGSLNFKRLRNVKLYLHNIYQCSTLISIFNMSKHATYLVIGIDNEKNLLNSSCFISVKDSKSEVESLGIIDFKMTSFIPLFAKKFLNISKYVRDISMADMRLSPSVFSEMQPKAFKYLSVLNLKNNYIDDAGFIHFVKSTLTDLKYLDISYTEITSSSVNSIANQTFQKLQYINLSGISYNSSINILTKRNMPNLKTFSLNHCSLFQLDFLKQMNLPNLIKLQLSFNEFSTSQFLQWLRYLKMNRQKMPQLKIIYCLGMSNFYLQRQQIQKYQQQLELTIYIDENKFIKLQNNAKY